MGSDLDYAGTRIRWIGSRVLDSEHHVQETVHVHHGHGSGHRRAHSHGHQQLPDPDDLDRPVFKKNHAATNFELFYDLWFVANLSVFGGIHDISGEKALLSFIGYIVLLWTTWAVTTLFDVRYTADSVLERCCRAVHLGVMVAFAEVGTSFNPDAQIKSVFRAMSFCLAASRFILAAQYAVVAFQVRRYVEGWRPLALTAFLHLAAAAVYFGISFRYDQNKNSRVYVVWYIVSVAELILHLIFSQLSEVLSFVGTHLGERLSLLTLIIIGEGAILLAKSVTLLVKDTYLKDATITVWSPALIGTVTASAALIYIVFQLYFDWLHEGDGMSDRHQVWWTGIHLPFHVTLVLMLEGANQFVIWARLKESVQAALLGLLATFDPGYTTSEDVAEALYKSVAKFLVKYPPSDALDTYNHLNSTLADIADVPDNAWTGDGNIAPEWIDRLTADLQEIAYIMLNSLYYAFGIEEDKTKASQVSFGGHGGGGGHDDEYMATAASQTIQHRFLLVLIYTFACSGIVLLSLTIIHAISKRRGWTPFNIARTAVCVLLAVGLSLVPTIVTRRDGATSESIAADKFIDSSMMLPTITLTFLIALVITHLPHPRHWGVGKYGHVDYATVEDGTTKKHHQTGDHHHHGPHVLRQLHLSLRRGAPTPTHQRHGSTDKSHGSIDADGAALYDRGEVEMRHRPKHASRHLSTASAGTALMSPEEDEFGGADDQRRMSHMSRGSVGDMDPMRSLPVPPVYDQPVEGHQQQLHQPGGMAQETRYDPGHY